MTGTAFDGIFAAANYEQVEMLEPSGSNVRQALVEAIKWLRDRLLGGRPWQRTLVYHLTPDGWVKGEDDAPANRVETWQVQAGARNSYAPAYSTWTCVWASPRVLRPERDALRARYPIGGWARYQVSWAHMEIGEPL